MTFKMVPLSEISEDVELWGGKAVALSKLIKAGLNVPDGFVISSEVYNEYITGNLNIDAFSLELLEKCTALSGNNKHKLIFRSSSNIEGKGGCDCPGLFDSILCSDNVSLVDNVIDVWKSKRSRIAKQFYNNMGIDEKSVNMSVIIQIFCREKISAVIQTHDLLYDKHRIIFEFSFNDLKSIVDDISDANIIFVDYQANKIEGDFSTYLFTSHDFYNKLIEFCLKVEDTIGGHAEIEALIDNNRIICIQARLIE